MLKFTFLIENKTDHPGCVAEHGLSLYLEKDGRKILFDAGATGLFAQNAEKLGVDLSAVDFAVISHGHYDHTGGFPLFCRLNSKAGIYVHQDAFREVMGFKEGKPQGEVISIPWTEEERAAMEPRLIRTEGVVHITEDICLAGNIPSIAEFAPTERFFIRNAAGELTPDPMEHEQALIIRERQADGSSKGLYVFSGCCHKGVIPTLRYVKTIFPRETICGFIAGMHLYSAGPEVRARVVSEIAAEDMEMVMPVHCTGINGICDLKTRLSDRCIVATTGDSYQC